ncbi:2-keto-4-pentenoate hydratase/2-oxohepta-3-ene-1,7-dioic acid hydratase in catechol pathway [Peribacillus deserti]|uniref:2-keto-4-pentenoate hydratase/2-oxohepta-3-ene-1,7-dioic acid hydratase in catechol pathway n=1 Tax=Peribacillus deserti TaxID=673318 RepID=A0ABS2QLE9_9BACI|nr:fumarylacetoacetate hydrolase family protein [Peribacillus deserti]MBM7693997.1 2-keto-4-pentenoate hydratase/2-oxohepta-3-ene-1,7-dioic acid hydratase in catechol pathway [Peribacillus deserti]
MKLATILHNNEQMAVVADDQNKQYLHIGQAAEQLLNKKLNTSSMLDCIRMGEEFTDAVVNVQEAVNSAENPNLFYISFDHAELLAPIPRPNKNIFCVGKNYAEHAIEMGSEADIPEHVMLFSKTPTTVIGAGEYVPNHEGVTDSLDYEGELAVIIGKTGKDIEAHSALEYIFGYTIINDVTARDLQAKHKQFLLGKSLDGSCPMGPYIVHHSAVPDPSNLDIETKINGEVRQKSNTSRFIFSIEDIISTISKGMTLEAGDIIATGTPAGVGKGFQPPKYLKSGDTMEISIEGIGTLTNIVK